MTAPAPTPVPLHLSPLAVGTSGGKSVPSDLVRDLHDLLPAGDELRHLLDADDARYAALAPVVEMAVAA